MFRFLLFWIGEPPPEVEDTEKWGSLVDGVGFWVFVCCVLFAAAIVFIYARAARRKKIHKVSDLFNRYTPMNWLWLSLFPVVFVWVYFSIAYAITFPGKPLSSALGDIGSAGLWAGALTFLLAYIPMFVRWRVTPVKHRYRPLWLTHRKQGRRKHEETIDTREDK